MFSHGLDLFILGRGSIFIYLSASHHNLSAKIYHLNHAARKTECGERIHGDTEYIELIEVVKVDQNKFITDSEAEG